MTAIIAILTSLVGLTIGHLLSSLNEHRRWLREKRFEIATKFLARIGKVHKEVALQYVFNKMADNRLQEVKSGDPEAVHNLYVHMREFFKEADVQPTEAEFASLIASSDVLDNQKDSVTAIWLADAGLSQEFGPLSKRVADEFDELLLIQGEMSLIFDADVCDAASDVVLSLKSESDDRSKLTEYVDVRNKLIRKIHRQLKKKYVPVKL